MSVLDPVHRWMLAVLDLDPVSRSTGAVWSISMFRDYTFQPHQAGVPEYIRPDLALFERCHVDAVDTSRRQPGQVGLAMLKERLRYRTA